MKRMVAPRKLKRSCLKCGCGFQKGNVYYKHREVYEEFPEVFAYEYLECPKCHYKNANHKKRYENFKLKCQHPKQFIDEVWDYIPGEAVMQPDHDVCLLCGEWV